MKRSALSILSTCLFATLSSAAEYAVTGSFFIGVSKTNHYQNFFVPSCQKGVDLEKNRFRFLDGKFLYIGEREKKHRFLDALGIGLEDIKRVTVDPRFEHPYYTDEMRYYTLREAGHDVARPEVRVVSLNYSAVKDPAGHPHKHYFLENTKTGDIVRLEDRDQGYLYGFRGVKVQREMGRGLDCVQFDFKSEKLFSLATLGMGDAVNSPFYSLLVHDMVTGRLVFDKIFYRIHKFQKQNKPMKVEFGVTRDQRFVYLSRDLGNYVSKKLPSGVQWRGFEPKKREVEKIDLSTKQVVSRWEENIGWDEHLEGSGLP